MESILLGEKHGFYLEPLFLAQAVGSLSRKVNHRFIAIKTLMSTFFFCISYKSLKTLIFISSVMKLHQEGNDLICECEFYLVFC